MNIAELDKADRRLLRELQADSTQSVAELADLVNLSASSCHRRIKILEQRGMISGYGAQLGREKLGLSIEFFVEISLMAQIKK